MGRVLAIDYGTKRTGLAVTDPLKIIATALETVRTHLVLDYLKKYIEQEEVEALVLGMPVNLDMTDTNSTQAVRTFEKVLKKNFPQLPVNKIDERLTSKMAADAMVRGGMKKKDRQKKGNLDKISAVIILQSYLEQQQL